MMESSGFESFLTRTFTSIGITNGVVIDILNIVIMLIIFGVIGWVIYLIAKKLLPKLVKKIGGTGRAHWGELLLGRKFFKRLALLLIPIIIKSAIIPFHWDYMPIIDKLLSVWIVLAIVFLISSVLDGINRIYETIASVKDKPVKVIIQVIKIVLWCAAVMIIISVFTNQKIGVLLAGLTAFAAVLMLVFQDTILGFVAGIQLSANNMVRIGDWIVMPSRGVDGDVIEIGLTTVKVQNFDKTITTVPTHKLVSESFTNWRGMEESKGRRIKRSVNIDVASIHYLTDDEIEKLKESALLKDYIEQKVREITDYNENRKNPLDERRLTNVGTFREYLELWIAHNPNINQEMTHMVRQLQPGPTGIPLEIYCFSARQGWIDYENVQSDVFDHLFAVLPLFNLRPFQYTGASVISEN